MADIKINLGAPTPSTPAGGAAPAAAGPAPATKPAAAPAAPTAPPPAPSAPAAGVSFQNIFNQTAKKTSGPKMIESIVSGKSDAASKMKPILGSAPTLQKTLEQEKEFRLKKKLRTSQMLFVLVFLASAAMALYFFSELSPSFNLLGPNTTARLTDVNKSLRALQTQVNKYRYLAAQLDLNRFSYVADQFLDKTAKLNDPNVAQAQKTQLAADVAEAENELPVLLERVRQNLNQDIAIQTFRSEAEEELPQDQIQLQFEDDLRTALKEDRALIAKSADGVENQQDLKLIDNTLKLVGNKKLINTIKGVSIDGVKKDLEAYRTAADGVKRKELQDLFASILSSTRSDIATISSLKNARVNWSIVIRNIETATTVTDKNFGRGLFETLGGVVYTGYEFDTQSNKIVLSGITKTNDASNFTLMSNLIDDLERSEHFRNVEMRSFTKSGTIETGFTANFKIELNLETDEVSPRNKPISLGGDSLKKRTGVKRIKR